METRSNQVLVGSITLGLVAALVLFIVWLSSVTGGGEKKYDVFFQQSVEGLAKGSGVTFSGVPVGQIESINLEPQSPQFIRVRISVSEDTPVLEGSTVTIRGVGFTGVSQIQIDPPENPPPGQPRRARREIRCPEANPQSECPYGVPVIPTRPGALGQLLNTAPELLERVSTLTERLTAIRIRSRAFSTISRRSAARSPSARPRSPRRWPKPGWRSARPATPPTGSASSPAARARCSIARAGR